MLNIIYLLGIHEVCVLTAADSHQSCLFIFLFSFHLSFLNLISICCCVSELVDSIFDYKAQAVESASL